MITLQDAVTKFILEIESSVISGSREAKTLKNYEGVFRRLLREIAPGVWLHNVEYRQIQPMIIEGKTIAGSPLAPATRNKFHRLLNSFFNWALANGYAKHNPMLNIRRPRAVFEKRPILSKDEVHRLVEALPQMLRDICLFFLYTGRRRGEVLDSGDGNFQPPLYIPQSQQIRFWLNKVHRYSYSPVPQNHGGLIMDIIHRYKNDRNEIIFPIKAQHFYLALKSIAAGIGIETDVHQLRRTFITNMLEVTQDLYLVSNILDVNPEQINKSYGWVLADRKKSAIEKLSY